MASSGATKLLPRQEGLSSQQDISSGAMQALTARKRRKMAEEWGASASIAVNNKTTAVVLCRL